MWSGWGIAVLGLGFSVFIGGVAVGEVIMTNLGLAYGPAFSAGYLICGVSATIAIDLIARWRESKPGRTLVDQNTGESFEFGGNAGDLLLIPVRYWSWIMLALTAVWTISLFDAQPPSNFP